MTEDFIFGSNLFAGHTGDKRLDKYKGNDPIVVIPGDVEIIGNSAFCLNKTLTSISIPGNVKEIESYQYYRSGPDLQGTYGAFAGCQNLVNVDLMEGLIRLGVRAFWVCTSLTQVNIPDSVREIGSFAFLGCTSLTSVRIPDNITFIGEDAFFDTPFLNNLPGDLKRSGRYLFNYAGEESNVEIPQGVEVICDCAFAGNEKLTSVVLPKGIAVINPDSFKNCKNLLEYKIFYRHESGLVPDIPGFGYVFISLLDQDSRQIGKLFLLDLKKDMPYTEFLRRLMSGRVNHLSEYDALFSSSDEVIIRKSRAALCRLQFPLELEEKYKKEYINFLQNNAQFTISCLIKEGDIAFISLMAEFGLIPKDGINTLIDQANELSSREILAFLMDHKNKTWGQEPALTLDQGMDDPQTEWGTQQNLDGSLNITKYLGGQQSFIIPAAIDGKTVKRIEGSIGSLKLSIFFPKKDLVKSVIIEEGIVLIGERAFLECSNLESVEIPASVMEIGKEAFFGCSSLVSITIPEGVNVIGESVFSGCASLKSLSIPENVKEIGASAFYGCTSLISITIPEGVTEIGRFSFSGCASLKSIAIPEGVTEIDSGTFSGCTNLKSISIPEGVTEIGNDAFSGCTSLVSISIPEGVTVIGYHAFSRCPKLVISAPKGSYAMKYATENNIKFEEI